MEKLKQYWLDFFQEESNEPNWWTRKKALLNQRDAKIIRVNGAGHIYQQIKHQNQVEYEYTIHLSYLIKHKKHIYREEEIIPYRFKIMKNELIDHYVIENKQASLDEGRRLVFHPREREGEQRFIYDRRAAVNYAEYWWDRYNPEFPKFDVDCTNFVSQCLLAGGAPMRGAPVRENGWWYQANNWSFSWAVAHSMRWYLSGSNQGLVAKEVELASELNPGDVICYDFQGDGRWDHTTIVVAKDANGMPLVNAHTDNSRHRYWSYEDSTAWTPSIKYLFFRIGE